MVHVKPCCRTCALDAATLEREIARLAAAAPQGLAGEEVFKALRRVLPGCTEYRDKHLALVK